MDAAKMQRGATGMMPKRDPNAKIKVEFDRASLSQRIKSRYLSFFFVKKVLWFLFRLVLLVGISFVVLYPFITKIAGSFMAVQDFQDVTVWLVPKNFTFDTYTAIFNEMKYMQAFINTFILSVTCAVMQTIVCCLIGYGLAKFKFKGAKWVFLAVMLTMVVPHQTLQYSLTVNFNRFDLRGPISAIFGGPGLFSLLGDMGVKDFVGGVQLSNTFFPLIILSLFGLAFKNGLYIFLLRQFFRGVPDELEESAYIDGSGTFKTFMKIIIPLSIPMMITVFLFSFSWQWTDMFYTNMFMPRSKLYLMNNITGFGTPQGIPASLAAKSEAFIASQANYYSAIRNTEGLMIIAPLVVMYVFCQKFLVQGIERSGLTAD